MDHLRTNQEPPLWSQPLPNRVEKLPVTDPARIRERDARLWAREQQKATEGGQRIVRCPCLLCKGHKLWSQRSVFEHLNRHGRHPDRRVWNDLDDGNSSDEEWREHFERSKKSRQDEFLGSHAVPVPANDTQPEERRDTETGDGTHGLDYSSGIEVQRMLTEIFATFDAIEGDVEEQQPEGAQAPDPELEAAFDQGEAVAFDQGMWEFPDLIQDACQPLYIGSRCSMLAFLVLFMNICGNHNVPNICVSELLTLLSRTVLPEGNRVPKNMYEAKKVITNLGLNFITIHACSKGCVLFRGDLEKADSCPVCNKNRFKRVGTSLKPVKVLRHFPLIPRLLRMYRCSGISELMTWTADNKSTDGCQRHAGDSKAWAEFDERHPDFASEKRNVRFGLSLDGVNPFGDKNNQYSIWPVTLVNYNIPPWHATKRFFVLLTLLIPGPESVVSDYIDVMLQPLIEELLQLWQGIMCHDTLRRDGPFPRFLLRAMLMWTFADYPAHGLISGRCTRGYLGCSACGPNVTSDYSKPLSKCCFLGHRRGLAQDHPFRHRANWIVHFNRRRELRDGPTRPTVDQVSAWADEKEAYDRAGGRPGGPNDPYKKHGVKRHSILEKLPYWKDLKYPHLLDVMHVEKNICESVMRYLSGEKDLAKVRKDLQDRGIRQALWLKPDTSTKPDGVRKYHAPYVLTEEEWQTFLSRMSSLKVPSQYAGAFKKHVKEKKFGSMKSHDYHIMMQQVLPICLRGLLQKPVRRAILSLCNIFNRLSVKVWDPRDYPRLYEDVILTLCQLEIHFPPAFFDVMTHLAVHVVEEVEHCGPVHYRWCYFTERYMKVVKRNVRTYSKPEASMAYGYIKDETLGYLTEYIQEYNSVKTRAWEMEQHEGVTGEVLEGKGTSKHLRDRFIDMAHEYVLRNTDMMEPWWQRWRDEKAQAEALPNSRKVDDFPKWIRGAIRSHKETHPDMDMDLSCLSCRPTPVVLSYKRMKAYGNHFRVLDSNRGDMVSYDCGLICVSEHRDERLGVLTSTMGFVGELRDIWLLNYGAISTPIILMLGNWVRNSWSGRNAAMKRDGDGLIWANFSQMQDVWSEPFVFPSQVEQGFFLEVEGHRGWRVVCHKEARNRRLEGDQVQFKLHDNEAFRQHRSVVEPVQDPGPTQFQETTRAQILAQEGLELGMEEDWGPNMSEYEKEALRMRAEVRAVMIKTFGSENPGLELAKDLKKERANARKTRFLSSGPLRRSNRIATKPSASMAEDHDDVAHCAAGNGGQESEEDPSWMDMEGVKEDASSGSDESTFVGRKSPEEMVQVKARPKAQVNTISAQLQGMEGMAGIAFSTTPCRSPILRPLDRAVSPVQPRRIFRPPGPESGRTPSIGQAGAAAPWIKATPTMSKGGRADVATGSGWMPPGQAPYFPPPPPTGGWYEPYPGYFAAMARGGTHFPPVGSWSGESSMPQNNDNRSLPPPAVPTPDSVHMSRGEAGPSKARKQSMPENSTRSSSDYAERVGYTKKKITLNAKGWIEETHPCKDEWCADIRIECLRWLDLSVQYFTDQHPADWRSVQKDMEARWEYEVCEEPMHHACYAKYGAKALRTERHRLHTVWKSCGEDPKMAAPPSMDGSQWAKLIKLWGTAASKKKSEKMVEARGAVKNPTTVGRGGHARIAKRMKEETGASPTKEEIRAEAKKHKATSDITDVSKAEGSGASAVTSLTARLEAIESLVPTVESNLSKRLDSSVSAIVTSNEANFSRIFTALEAMVGSLLCGRGVGLAPSTAIQTVKAISEAKIRGVQLGPNKDVSQASKDGATLPPVRVKGSAKCNLEASKLIGQEAQSAQVVSAEADVSDELATDATCANEVEAGGIGDEVGLLSGAMRKPVTASAVLTSPASSSTPIKKTTRSGTAGAIASLCAAKEEKKKELERAKVLKNAAKKGGGAAVGGQTHYKDGLQRVTLQSLDKSRDVVAFGKLRKEQTGTIHGRPIPKGFLVVEINLIRDAKYALPVPNPNADPPQVTIADAMNTFILWPTKATILS